MRIPGVIGVVLASVVGTAAFIMACNGGPGPAGAQSSCAAWEVSVISVGAGDNGCTAGVDYPASCRLPDGWEPFSVPGFTTVTARRCAR